MNDDGRTYFPNHVDQTYQGYLRHILDNGYDSRDRTGTGTTKLFGRQLRFDLTEGFPLLTTKRVWFKGVAAELLWFLSGSTNIRPLLEEGVSIWTDWPYDRYKQESVPKTPGSVLLSKEEFERRIVENDTFARRWGDLGPVYGKQWRCFDGLKREWGVLRHNCVDQIAELIDGLREKPNSRRHLVSAWHPAQIEDAALPPCHYAFQCFTRELDLVERIQLVDGHVNTRGTPHEDLDQSGVPRYALSLMWQQRSVDSFLGLPFNIASYALLTHMIAQRVNMIPEELIFSGGDCHIYNNHREQVEEQLSRVGDSRLPTLELEEADSIDNYSLDDVSVKGYDPQPAIGAPIAV